MPNFHVLSSALTFPGTNVVIVGGTSGIGAAIAVRFAELGASVLIIGRNETSGSDVVKKLEATSSNNGHDRHGVRFGFARRDLGSVKEIKAAAEDIAMWTGRGGIHYLFQTQGGPSAGTYDTTEAVNNTFNAMILSHFLIPYLLVTLPEPILRKDTHICNIARPGLKNQAIDFDDFVCLKAVEAGTFRPYRDTEKHIFMMDLFTHEFNMRFPHTHTTHLWPGLVATPVLSRPAVPWWIRIAWRVLMRIPFMMRSPEQYADVAIWEIASQDAKAMDRTFWDEYGREVDVDERVKSDFQLRVRVWDKLLELAEAM